MLKKVVKIFASLKLAVGVIILLAILTAVGTIVESRYDAFAAQKLVYHTWWMYSVLGLLSLSLIAVMVDRWPWKEKHIPFILAHIGILVLLAGSVMTAEMGLDGTMRFGIGEKNRFVTVPTTDLIIWSSFDGDRYSKILEKEVDFFRKHPKDKPFKVDLAEGPLVIDDYNPYVIPNRQVVATDKPRSGAGIRYQLQGSRANTSDWVLQSRPESNKAVQVGLANVVIGPAPLVLAPQNAIYLTPKNDQEVAYILTYQDEKRKPKRGVLKEGDSVETGWMDLQFRLIRFLPMAEETFDFKVIQRPTPLTTSAVKVNFQGKSYWTQLNDVLKIFTEQSVYIITYGNRRIDLKFDIFLKKFEVGRYHGTNRAASYQSLVETPEGEEVLISMNEPLKYKGLTFYQASFEEGPDLQPKSSILSVNYDPGRWVKYLGSLIICLGIVWLFYQKRRSARAQAPQKGDI
jgi:hypothetical protein